MNDIPALNGNWIDLLIILAFLIYLFGGIRRGFILGLLDLTSFILSFFSAVKFYSFGASLLIANFNLPRGISNALGFLLVGFISELILSFVAHQIIKYIPLSWRANRIEKIFGVLPAVGNTLISSAFILTLIIILPVQGSIKSSVVTSKIGGYLVTKTQKVEKNLNQIFGGAIEESLTFLTVKPESQETVDLNFTQNTTSVDLEAESEMFNLVNSERGKAGIPLLEIAQDQLLETARTHGKDMFERGYFSHYNPDGESPFDRMKRDGVKYVAAGENLALAPTSQLAHEGLMNSPGHRANVLSPDFGKVAVGVIDGGIYGKMFVQLFTN